MNLFSFFILLNNSCDSGFRARPYLSFRRFDLSKSIQDPKEPTKFGESPRATYCLLNFILILLFVNTYEGSPKNWSITSPQLPQIRSKLDLIIKPLHSGQF